MEGPLATFAQHLEGTTEAPLRFMDALERELGLADDQFLALSLLVFLLVSALAFPVIARVQHVPGWKSKPLAIVMVGLWVSTGMGVECRAGTTDTARTSGTSGGVVDVGHQLLEPVNSWAIESPAPAQLIASMNSVYCIAIGIMAMWSVFGRDDPRLLLAALPAGGIRMVMGVLTRMPVPDGYVAKPGDWPPPSPRCRGFVLNPSGHVMNATLVCLYLYRVGHTRMCIAASILNGAQAVWLVSARGHYTVDIITALLICVAVEPAFGAGTVLTVPGRGSQRAEAGRHLGAWQTAGAKKHR